MNSQLLVLAAIVAVSIAVPQNNVQGADAVQDNNNVAVAEKAGADDSSAKYQNDYYYTQYGLQWAPGRVYSTNWYVNNRMVYNKMASDLVQCQRELAALTLAAGSQGEVQKEVAVGSKGEVQKEVAPKEEVEEEVEEIPCEMEKDAGPCFGYFPRYYFNKVTKTCEKFIYGGCGGNANNYVTKKECLKSCTCSLPVQTSYCGSYAYRWHYDSTEGQCKKFIYGGCGGNHNNFLSRAMCEYTCSN